MKNKRNRHKQTAKLHAENHVDYDMISAIIRDGGAGGARGANFLKLIEHIFF